MTAQAEQWTQGDFLAEWNAEFLAGSPHGTIIEDAIEDPALAQWAVVDSTQQHRFRDWDWNGGPLSPEAIRNIVMTPHLYARDTVEAAWNQMRNSGGRLPDSTYRQHSEDNGE